MNADENKMTTQTESKTPLTNLLLIELDKKCNPYSDNADALEELAQHSRSLETQLRSVNEELKTTKLKLETVSELFEASGTELTTLRKHNEMLRAALERIIRVAYNGYENEHLVEAITRAKETLETTNPPTPTC